MPGRLFLIDASSYIHRAYHAVGHLANSRGEPTGAIYGFYGMLQKVLKDHEPDYIAVCYDSKGPTFRDEIYPEYKANRPSMPEDLAVQIPKIRALVEALRIPTLAVPGLEADDLIATLARAGEAADLDVMIVGGDKDFLQLVTDRVKLMDTMKDTLTGPAEVRAKFGVDPPRMADIQALMGDAIDNVPGVPGVGEKTAAELVQQYGDLDGVLAHAAEVKRKNVSKALLEHADDARLSMKLVRLRTDAPLPFRPTDCKPTSPDEAKLRPLLQSLGFTRFLKDTAPARVLPEDQYRTVSTPAELQDLVARLRKAGKFAFDTETTGTNPVTAEPVGFSFSCAPGEAWYIPIAHRYLGVPKQLERAKVLEALKPLYEDPGLAKYAQNAKYDLAILRRCGIRVKGLACDTMVASYVLNPARRQHNLGEISRELFGHQMITYEDVTGKGKTQIGFGEVDIATATRYSAEDSDVTFRAAEEFLPKIRAGGLEPLFRDVEMPLIEVLLQMELDGIRVDDAYLRKVGESLGSRLKEIEQQIYTAAKGSFNIESPKQLQEVLFERLGLSRGRKTKTGYSTDMEVLAKLAQEHPVPALILDYRSLAKLKNTYVDTLPELMHQADGRVHTSFNQTVAATGRLSSSDPNLQNIPVRTPEGKAIRRAFVPEPGWVMISADYSQVELRILAHLSGDPELTAAFRSGEDVHTRTACGVFNVTPDMVSSDMRRRAKAINFGIIYGMSAHGLAQELKIPHAEAQQTIEQYFKRYAGVKAFLDKTLEEARRTMQVTTLLGRRRSMPEINAPNPMLRGSAERMAVNTPVQGTAADIIKVAMIRTARRLEETKLPAKMLLQVHDELVLECEPKAEKKLVELVREAMEEAVPLSVPLKVDFARGENWADLEGIEMA